MTDDSSYKADMKQKEGSPKGEPSYSIMSCGGEDQNVSSWS